MTPSSIDRITRGAACRSAEGTCMLVYYIHVPTIRCMYTNKVTGCHSYSNKVSLDIIVTTPVIPLSGETCRSTHGQVVSRQHWLQSLFLLLSKDLVCYLLPQEEILSRAGLCVFFCEFEDSGSQLQINCRVVINISNYM